MARRRTTTMVVAALLLLAVVAAPVQAHPGHHEPEKAGTPAKELPASRDRDGDVKRVSQAEAERADATLVAKRAGWTVDAAAAHLRAQDAFGELLVALADQFPDRLGAGVFADQPGGDSTVSFVGQVPDEAKALAERAGVPVTLEGGAKRSQQATRALSVEVHRLLADQGVDVVTAARPDGTVDATVAGDKAPELPKALAGDVHLTRVDGRIADDHHSRGGALVWGASSSCTSGFAVQSTSGTTGVTTAGHCTGINTYQEPVGGLTYGLTHQAEHRGFFGDIEWKTSSHIEPAEYYARATEQRDVNSVEPYGAIAVNNWYCVYGRFSNNRVCDQVYRTFVSATVNGVWNSSLVAMDDNNTISGDSGGPWSFGTEATGSTKGYVTIWFSQRNVWSVAALYPLALGVSVRT